MQNTIKPMLLQSIKEPFDSDKYIFEWKADGMRCLLFKDEKKVKLQSRHGKDCTCNFPELLSPKLNAQNSILDGEIVVLINGKPDFESVMERYMSNPEKNSGIVKSLPASYVVWDILYKDDKFLTNLPLMERKCILAETLENTNTICKIDYIENKGVALFDAVKSQGLEGIVAKAKNSSYKLGKRSQVWIKVKNYQEKVVNVLGYSIKNDTILVGQDKIVQGHAIGIKGEERKAFKHLLDKYGTLNYDVYWLPHGIRGRVKFTNWTGKGNMRDCCWIGYEFN